MSGVSVEGFCVSRGAGLGSFGVVFMFIGFAVGFFEAAKSDVFFKVGFGDLNRLATAK